MSAPQVYAPPSGGATPGADSGATPGSTVASNDTSTVQFIAAWGIFLLLMVLLNRTRWGHAIIYYTLALAMLLLFLVNYRAVGAILAPVSQGGGEPMDTVPSDTTGPAGASQPPAGYVTAAAPKLTFA